MQHECLSSLKKSKM